jgi:DNA-binding CsgD family transcriptional regulator
MKSQKPGFREPPVHVVLIDKHGVIIDVKATDGKAENKADPAMDWYAAGESYLDHCDDAGHRAEVQALLKRKRSLISFVFPFQAGKRKRWFVAVGVPVGEDGGALLMHIDITASVPDGRKRDYARTSQPETLSPALVQDTIAKALAKQFAPTPSQATEPPNNARADIDSLSPRQREVLLLVAAGKSNSEIADELSCSLNTVKRHVTAVLQKLRLPNRTRAAMLATQLKLGPGFR